MQKFIVVVRLANGETAVYPMKKWLRRNPGVRSFWSEPNIRSYSYELRSALKKRGWQVEQSDQEVRLVMPGSANTLPADVPIREKIRPHAIGSHEQKAMVVGGQCSVRSLPISFSRQLSR